MHWLRETMHDCPPVARMVNTDLMTAAATEGVGVAVLPCFIGDKIAGLVRISEQIEVLRADYWTLIQPDLAKNPSVRVIADWIVESFRHANTPKRTFEADIP